MRLTSAPLAPVAFASLLSLGLLGALAGSAAAQSGPPGQCACTPPPQALPPQAWPVPAEPVAAPEPWEAHRLGVGLRVGGLTLSERATDGSEDQSFSMGGLVARYRASRRIELELAIEGGREQLDHGYESSYQMSAVTAAALIHLTPQSEWDWYLLGGLGANDRRYEDDSDDYADQRTHLALGVGLERRWEHLALGVELRALAMSAREDQLVNEPLPYPQPEPAPVPTAAVVIDDSDDGEPGGAQLSVSATWYF